MCNMSVTLSTAIEKHVIISVTLSAAVEKCVI